MPTIAAISTLKAPDSCQACLPRASGILPAFSSAGAAATNSSQFVGTGTPASAKALLDSHIHCQEWMLTGTQ